MADVLTNIYMQIPGRKFGIVENFVRTNERTNER